MSREFLPAESHLQKLPRKALPARLPARRHSPVLKGAFLPSQPFSEVQLASRRALHCTVSFFIAHLKIFTNVLPFINSDEVVLICCRLCPPRIARMVLDSTRRCGDSEMTWHCNRHTFASRLVMAGVDLRTVAELLGHRTLQMVMRYAHLAPEHQASAVDRLVPAGGRMVTNRRLANLQRNILNRPKH